MRLVSTVEARLQVLLLYLILVYSQAFRSHSAQGRAHVQRSRRGRTLTALSIMDNEPTFHPPAALRNREPILSFLQSLSWVSSHAGYH